MAALKISLHLVWRALRIGLLVAVSIFALILLTLRYWILPGVERYHDRIADSISAAINRPVSIGQIEADWRGLRPRLLLRDVRIKDEAGQDALALARTEGVLAWTTLLTGSVRLHSLEIDQPDLLVRRDTAGTLYVAGIDLSKPPTGENNPADWLLQQTHIAVRDARVTWLDEQRVAPPLTLEHLDLQIQNGWGRHRFAVLADPPQALSARLDVRGDFTGSSFDDLSGWRGVAYIYFDYVDPVAWRAWVPLPEQLRRGRGALRGWLGVADGRIDQFTADLVLDDVRARLGKKLAPLDLDALKGRIAWRESNRGIEISTQKLALKTRGGIRLSPIDFNLRYTAATQAKPADGEVSVNTLELTDLARIADTLPLAPELKQGLAEYAPRGQISNLQAQWEGEIDAPQHYQVKARFDQLALNRVGDAPGFSGLSGELEGGDEAGNVSLDARALVVDWPDFLAEGWQFDALSGRGSWQKYPQGIDVHFDDVAVRNKDVEGKVYGSFRSVQGQRGVIDLNIDLARGAIGHAANYIPLIALDEATQHWLSVALVDGRAENFHLRLRGDLDKFPFAADSPDGHFEIKARIHDGVLQYAPEWPSIERIDGELALQGRRLQVTAPSASTLGMQLQNVEVVIPDMATPERRLQVVGEATGETQSALEFVDKSPVRGYIDGITDGMAASGSGVLQLKLDVPLATAKNPVVVAGSYRFADNDIDVSDEMPLLRKSSGELRFTESSMRAENVSTQFLGSPAMLNLESGKGGLLKITARGHADADTLRREMAAPWLDYLRGGSDWEAVVSMQKRQAVVAVTSTLRGMESRLPAPFAKSANEPLPLRLEISDSGTAVRAQLGSVLTVRLLRREENGKRVVQRGVVHFGEGARELDRDGVWLTGALPQVSLADWGGVLSGGDTQGVAPLPLEGVDLNIGKLDAYGYAIDNLHVSANSRGRAFVAQLAAEDMNGEASWGDQGSDRLTMRLRNLTLKDDAKATQATRETVKKSGNARYPALDLAVDDLVWRGRKFGKAQLLASQSGNDWNLERLHIDNPDGALTASGTYAAAQTKVNVRLDIVDSGKMLARFGYPGSMEKGGGKLTGDFSWRGAPDQFDYASLDGRMTLALGRGQFLKIDPGMGRLLGILSLQALPSRISLDFTDVFSEGMAFNDITGEVEIRHGLMQTENFTIDGLGAKVAMQGTVDLGRETQRLRMRVLPAMTNSASVLGAFAAGPAVGLGAFVASKILQDPLDKLMSIEYNVTGTWDDPVVVKVSRDEGR